MRAIHNSVSVLNACFAILFCIVLIFLYGFWVYVQTVDTMPVNRTPQDGIVVLTGESSRIRTGIDLLEARLGRRLLISGVAKQSQPNHLLQLKEQKSSLFQCCVDLGFEAVDTVSNAREAADWVQRYQFKSILVVTSAYHMPRAMLELRQALPKTQLVPYASTVKRSGSIWKTPDLLKRYAIEYVKLCASWLRIQLLG